MRKVYAHIPILPIEELRKLPEPQEFEAGLYFLWEAGELVYIGKAKDLKFRTGRQWQILHMHESTGGQEAPRPFDTCTVLVTERGELSRGWDIRLMEMERAYLGHYEPKYNSMQAMGS
jgi:hypothetical protein